MKTSVNITWDQQDGGGTAAVEDFPDGNDIGVIRHPTVEAFDVAESVVSVTGQRVAIAPSKNDPVFYCAKARLPRHRSQIVLTLQIGLHIIGWARL